MNLRTDLLELTAEALTALANAGFVKRAQKDIAAGLLPRLDVQADGLVRAFFDDGICTELAPGRALRDAFCTCSASTMCRHRVMLVLAYQARESAGQTSSPADYADKEVAAVAVENPVNAAMTAPETSNVYELWSPAAFDDTALLSSFTPFVLEQAAKLASARPVVAVQAGRSASVVPMAQLPMCSVRFFSRSALAHARCDCKQGSGCAHVVLALWAFRQAGLEQPGVADVMVELKPRTDSGGAVDARASVMQGDAARTLCVQIDKLLEALWLDGSGQPTLALAMPFEMARNQALSLGWCWVSDAIDELWQLLLAQEARSSRFDPVRLVGVLAGLWARLQAAHHASQPGSRPALLASQILGIGVKGEVALDHLRLVSLGAELWADDASEGASVLFVDPDTQTVTVLERQWPRVTANSVNTGASSTGGGMTGGTASAASTLANRRVAGFPLRQLASGQVITKTALRRANGLVEITAGARQTSVLPLSPKSWDALVAPLRQRSVAALIAHLQALPPDFVRPRQAASGAAGALHVVALDSVNVLSSTWDPAAQVLHAQLAPVLEPDEVAMLLKPVLHLALPHRAVAPGAVDTLARALAGEWGALLAVAGTVRLQGGQAIMQPLSVLTAQRAVVLQVESPAPHPLTLHGKSEANPPLLSLAHDTLELLAQLLRQGLRHQASASFTRIDAQVALLREAGLETAGKLLDEAVLSLRSANRPALVAQLATLSLLLRGIAQ